MSGSQLFGFDYHAVTELLLVKSDPETGDRWAARMYKEGIRAEADSWRVERAGGEQAAPVDTRADGFFILHLLDTLRTLRVERTEVSGPPQSLGLAPPRFALKWKVDSRELEVQLGARATSEGEAEKAGAVRVFGMIPGEPPFVADGATLQMLSYISSFNHLRLKTWVGVNSDDVDEIELEGAAGAFYAQREGSDWTDRKHRPHRADVDAWLERLVHERVLTFVDDPARVESLTLWLRKNPLLKATLKDRRGQAVRLSTAQLGGHWYALSSARPQSIFEVHPESKKALSPPTRK